MASRVLVLGGTVVALGQHGVLTDAGVVVEGERVVAVGPREEMLALGPFDRTIGGSDHLVMPGFMNGHYHSELAVGPGLYQFIFERANVYVHAGYGPIEERDLYLCTQLALVNAIKGGQTGVVDMYYGRPSLPHYGAEVALQAYLDMGFRVAFGLVSRDQNRYAHITDEAFLRRLPPDLAREVAASPMGYAWPVDEVMRTYDHLADAWDGRGGIIRTVLAPDWTPACSDDLYRLCRSKADEYGTGITSHVLETRSEMLWSNDVYGKPAVQRLADLGVLGPDMVCAHFVWVTDDELRIFADSGAVASNNAGSNLRLSSGICRARDILETGGRLTFGTDGISFSDSEDMFTELRLATYLQRDPRVFDEVRLDSETVLRAAAENGARAIRQEGRVGVLAAGYDADLLVLDARRILAPAGRFAETPVLDVLIDRAQAVDLRTVMVRGRVLMDDGVVTVVDEGRLNDELHEALSRRVYSQSPEVARWLELARQVEPAVIDFFRPGYDRPVEPAAVYNARRATTGR